jgi:hypothetical protein
VQYTWIKVIENEHFATLSSVTVGNVHKYLPKSDSIIKGQHIRSTQTTVTYPTPEPEIVQEEKCRYEYAVNTETGQIYTDLTCRFPTTSLSGNKYILILYDNNSNSSLSMPMKNRGDKEIVRSFDLLIQSLIIHGLRTIMQCLDNEASLALRNYLTKQGIDYKLAPPHIHGRNNAERTIQTFKKHFIAGLCSSDPSFPFKLWDTHLPQETIAINLLRKSRINPHMSAYPNAMEIMISTLPPWHHLAPASSHIKTIPTGLLGSS